MFFIIPLEEGEVNRGGGEGEENKLNIRKESYGIQQDSWIL